MSFSKRDDVKKKKHIDFLCGWGAGCIETCIMYPSNKVIFRQQLHGISAVVALSQIKAEGMGMLYRGLLPPLMMRTTTRALMFGMFDEFQNMLKCPHSPPNSSFSMCHAQAAFLAGVCEASLCPFERVQVLLQTSAYHGRFKNTAQAFKDVYARYGIKEFYRGFSVILPRNGFSNVLFFTLRDPFKQLIMQPSDHKDIPTGVVRLVADFISGAVLGASISTLFYPLQVVKNNMQSKVGKPFENPTTVMQKVWHERNGSIKALYLGVHLNFTRSLIGWGITNTIFELLRRTFSYFE